MREKQSVFLKNFAKLILWAFEQGYEVTAGELLRTDEQHALNLANGKSKAVRSKHQDKLAGDLNLFIKGVYQTDTAAFKPLGIYWKGLHIDNVWGGDFKGFPDGNHFEMR